MSESVIANLVMNAYGIFNVENYSVVKIEPDNVKIMNNETKQIWNLRY